MSHFGKAPEAAKPRGLVMLEVGSSQSVGKVASYSHSPNPMGASDEASDTPGISRSTDRSYPFLHFQKKLRHKKDKGHRARR